MKTNKISLRRLTNFGLLLFMTFYVLVNGQSIWCHDLRCAVRIHVESDSAADERRIKSRSLAIALAMLTVIVPIVGTVYLFSKQCYKVVNDMPSIKEKLSIWPHDHLWLGQEHLGLFTFRN